ncbi:anti-sigma regulatory factor (Ser/Thr protein kinase) [Spinactinospora alkalitolerans]|uniref:Anti-sigma regulatory factor (Ser/Thr protein kinase) n=1 Tax=Spinactinospora alkalitolerans TaxID=687207 RepID=A0A852TLY5_9ACTN|nr:sensor histidine kinase [Spinactinospora alkalitolerans]NYE45256.1 anti-sigma regulatory factor (Ser/Thr protein kinase) [Spinactinospora alkalitolerans]
MTSYAEPESTGVECFEHHGVLFHSAAELRDSVVPRLREGVAAGDHVVVALHPRHEAAVRGALAPRERDAVDFTAHALWYEAPGRTLAALHRLTLLHGDRRITVIGQPVLPVENSLELREWHRLDSVLDAALAEMRMRLLCVHDAHALPSSVQEAVWHTHRAVIAGGAFRRSHGYRDPVAYSAGDAAEPLPPPSGHVRTMEIVADLPALREEAVGLAAATGLPKERLSDLVVAVNEMAANVLEHGAGKGTVSLWRLADRVVCDVFDEGGDLADPLSGYYPTTALSVRGYGLWITRQVCDFMEVRGSSEGSLVRLHFKV